MKLEKKGVRTSVLIFKVNNIDSPFYYKKKFKREGSFFYTKNKGKSFIISCFVFFFLFPIIGKSEDLIDENGHLKSSLIELFQILDYEEDFPSLSSLNSFAQKNLLRSGERWEAQTEKFEEVKSQIYPYLEDLGFTKARLPALQNYKGAILHGGFLPRVKIRLAYLSRQWDLGVRFQNLYFVGGDRPLDPLFETEEILWKEEPFLKMAQNPSLSFPKTEKEMMEVIWKYAEISDAMRKNVSVHFISAPMQWDSHLKKWKRPTAEDAFREWLKTDRERGKYLFVANAPYIGRLGFLMQKLGSGYEFDLIGPEACKEEKMIIFLDELARFLFLLENFSRGMKE